MEYQTQAMDATIVLPEYKLIENKKYEFTMLVPNHN